MHSLSKSPKFLLFLGLLVWGLFIVATTPLAHMTTAAGMQAVLLFIKGVGIVAIARGFMMAGAWLERRRSGAVDVHDPRMGAALTHITGGAMAVQMLSIVTILSAVLR